MAGWKAKLLSTGGRIIMIKHVHQSLHMYSLVAFDLPKVVLNKISSILCPFFLGRG